MGSPDKARWRYNMDNFNLTNIQKRQLFTIFTEFDTNKDGYIQLTEFRKVLKHIGEDDSEQNTKELLKLLDDDKDGRINFKEFTVMADSFLCNEPDKEKLRKASKSYDTNKNGFIEPKELKRAVDILGFKLKSKELKDMMKDADKDKDGKLNYNE